MMYPHHSPTSASRQLHPPHSANTTSQQQNQQFDHGGPPARVTHSTARELSSTKSLSSMLSWGNSSTSGQPPNGQRRGLKGGTPQNSSAAGVLSVFPSSPHSVEYAKVACALVLVATVSCFVAQSRIAAKTVTTTFMRLNEAPMVFDCGSVGGVHPTGMAVRDHPIVR